MKKTVAKSFAKINLSLDVLGKRDNGYHDVQMVMQTVSVFDIVTVTQIKHGIELSTKLPYLPIDNNNLAYKAAEEFAKDICKRLIKLEEKLRSEVKNYL